MHVARHLSPAFIYPEPRRILICILLDKDFYNKLIESANSLSEELVAALAAAAVVDHVVVVVDEGGVGIVRILRIVIAIDVLKQVYNNNLICI